MLVSPDDGELIRIGGFGTRYAVPSPATRGAAAVVEHTLEPGLLGAPMHRHAREDEISCVLAGELTIRIGAEVVTASVGDVVLKPRGVFHTFWNAGDVPVRFLEVIAPGGFEGYFRELRSVIPAEGPPDLAAIVALAARYGLEFDLASVPDLLQSHGLRLG
jgi:mannose-6-phosphate isomerase-like protein (cupin superfamily)